MNKNVENLQCLKRRIVNIKYGDEGFLDEIVVHGQEALIFIEPESLMEEEQEIAEAIRNAKKIREGDPLMLTRNQKEIIWSKLSQGLNRAIEKLK